MQRSTSWEPSSRASLRHRVAVEAARLLYHREYKEYYQAKRAAARRQGTIHLPSNREIHEQMLLIAQNFDAAGHRQKLRAMREAALALMEVLGEFHPKLIGSVLKGVIRQGSDIDINCYGDDLELVCQALEAAGLTYEVEHVQVRKGTFTHIHLEQVGGFEAEITLYPLDQVHVRQRCGISGGPIARASRAELRLLLSEVPSLPSYSAEQLLERVTELESCRGVVQNHYHHLDVYFHTLAVVRGLKDMVEAGFARFEPWSQALRQHISDPTMLYLAAVCHDLGKPATQAFARDGRITFHGHEHESARLCGPIAERLGLPAEPLVALVELHMEAVHIPTQDCLPSRIHPLFKRLGDNLPLLALLSLADVEAARGPAQHAQRLDEHFEFVMFLLEQYFSNGFIRSPTVPVSITDLIEELAVRNPKQQAKLLEWLTGQFVDGHFESREEGLCLASEWLAFPV